MTDRASAASSAGAVTLPSGFLPPLPLVIPLIPPMPSPPLCSRRGLGSAGLSPWGAVGAVEHPGPGNAEHWRGRAGGHRGIPWAGGTGPPGQHQSRRRHRRPPLPWSRCCCSGCCPVATAAVVRLPDWLELPEGFVLVMEHPECTQDFWDVLGEQGFRFCFQSQ